MSTTIILNVRILLSKLSYKLPYKLVYFLLKAQSIVKIIIPVAWRSAVNRVKNTKLGGIYFRLGFNVIIVVFSREQHGFRQTK